MLKAHRGPPRSTWRTVALVATLGAVALAALAGCGSSGSQSPVAAPIASSTSSAMSKAGAGSDSMPSTAMIHIGSFAYATPTSVGPGAKVGVMNMDSEAHTVTADSGGAFDVKAPAGLTVTFTAPTKPGSYPFHCTYHSNMHGVLIVK